MQSKNIFFFASFAVFFLGAYAIKCATEKATAGLFIIIIVKKCRGANEGGSAPIYNHNALEM